MKFGTDDGAGQDAIEAFRRQQQRRTQLRLMSMPMLRMTLKLADRERGVGRSGETVARMKREDLIIAVMEGLDV